MIFVFTDPHIEEKNLDELEDVFKEMYEVAKDCTRVICVGDYFHKKRITANELIFGTKWASKFLEIGDFILLRGNHPEVSSEVSVVDYLTYLGVDVVEDYIWNNIYFGHKMLEESDMFFGHENPKYETTLKELSKYKYSILGHQHKFQNIKDKVYHLGSCIYSNFNEVEEENKYMAIIDIDSTINFIKIQSLIPMYETNNVEELDEINPKTKVRLIFNNFKSFKNNIGTVSSYKNKFYDFKVKCNFTEEEQKKVNIEENIPLNELVDYWLNKVEDNEVKKELEDEFKKHSL